MPGLCLKFDFRMRFTREDIISENNFLEYASLFKGCWKFASEHTPSCFHGIVWNSNLLFIELKKNMLSASQRGMVIYEYVCHCDSRYAGRTTQRRIKQHLPKRQGKEPSPTQEQETHRSQPTRIQQSRKCKAKSKTQFEPEMSNLGVSQHLLESNQWLCTQLFWFVI